MKNSNVSIATRRELRFRLILHKQTAGLGICPKCGVPAKECKVGIAIAEAQAGRIGR